MKFLDKAKLLDSLVLKVLEAAHANQTERRPVIDRAMQICIQLGALSNMLEATKVMALTGMSNQEAVTTMLGTSPTPESSLKCNPVHHCQLLEGQQWKGGHRFQAKKMRRTESVTLILASTPGDLCSCLPGNCLVCYFVRYVARVGCWIRNRTMERGRNLLITSTVIQKISFE